MPEPKEQNLQELLKNTNEKIAKLHVKKREAAPAVTAEDKEQLMQSFKERS